MTHPATPNAEPVGGTLQVAPVAAATALEGTEFVADYKAPVLSPADEAPPGYASDRLHLLSILIV